MIPLIRPGIAVQTTGTTSLQRLATKLKDVRTNSLAFNDVWSGEIDDHLKGFLDESYEILLSDEVPQDNRADRFLSAAAALGGYQGVPPQNIEQTTGDQRREFSKYFASAYHHGQISTEEFQEKLIEVAEYLASILRPPAFVDQQRLDESINAGEQDAD